MEKFNALIIALWRWLQPKCQRVDCEGTLRFDRYGIDPNDRNDLLTVRKCDTCGKEYY